MTLFRQFVFFLTTAQDQMDRFFGEEKCVRPVTSHVGPDLIVPGTYLARDGAIVPEESIESGKIASIHSADAAS